MNIPIVTKLLEAKVDRDGCMVEGIILTCGLSENGTWYSQEVVGKAASIFEGVQCYADHPKAGETERSVRDVVGAIESAWIDGESLRATIRLSRAHDWLLTMIGEGLVGDLSINALGKTRVSRRDGRVVREVTEITKAFSVDFVARAAAGGHVERVLSESAGYAESLKLLESISAKEFEEARPDIIEKLRESIRDEILNGDGTLQAELKALDEELENRGREAGRSLTALSLIEKSGLPMVTMDYLIEQAKKINVDSDDEYEEAVKNLVEGHRTYLAGLAGEGLIKGMGSSKDSAGAKSSMERATLRLMGVGR